MSYVSLIVGNEPKSGEKIYLFVSLYLKKDFHGSWDAYIGVNAPLYPRENEPLEQTYLNIDHLINYYLSKGLSKEKLILGMATYGRTFTLTSADKNELGSTATGPGTRGNVFLLLFSVFLHQNI